MHPDEERPFLVHVQPGQRVRHHLTTAAFDGMVTVFSRAPPVETSIVGVKSAVKTRGRPRSRIEDQRADKRRCVISIASKDIGSVGQVLGERHSEIVYLVELWIRARQDGGVRRR